MKALIIDRVSPVVEQGLKKNGFDVDIKILPSKEQLKKLVPLYDLLIMRVDPKIDKELLEAAAGHIRMIGICSAGTNHIDLECAKKLGIFVQNAPGINKNAVAELTIAKMIDLSRMCVQANNEVQYRGLWNKYKYTGHELKGHTLGIIGLGNIGKRVAVLAAAFGMKIYAVDPYIPDEDFTKVNACKVDDVKELCKKCDYITLHTPINSETKGIISREVVRVMKNGAFLINCARGGLVDEEAVAEALKDHKLFGYGADVLQDELSGNGLSDNAKLNSPLIGMDGFIVSPHIGGSTHEAYDSIGEFIVNKVVEYFKLK